MSAGKPDPGQHRPKALLDTQQMVMRLLESASEAILGVDRSGRIILANRRAEEIFNYTRAELIGANLEILLPESKRVIHGRLREEYFERPRVRPMGIGMELTAHRRDGSEFPIEVSLSVIETPEGIVAFAFISDISRRKQLEEQLIHAQKMEAVGRLAGGVAHDFNNMLTVISGYSRMMLDDLPPGDPLREYAEEIGRAAERAGGITNQLLSFSRRQMVQPQVINVNELISQTEKMLHPLLGEDIQLILNLADDVANIKADPNQIEQAIVNLAVNSRDAMPNGGKIFLQTANAHLDDTYVQTHLATKSGEYVMIAITDTGQGMDPEVRKRIFEPFFTTKERGKGTGLGLATIYGMVKQSGGGIWVSSEVGKGTTFKLYFPLATEVPSETKSESPERVVSHDVCGGADTVDTVDTILLVEDEKPVRELTVRMLQNLGYSVLAAASGPEAIQISNSFSGHISMLLTDIVMPDMNGKQVAEALVGMRPGIKVLYLSGYTEHAVIHHGIGSEAAFLAKPFSRETLSRKMAEVLNGRTR